MAYDALLTERFRSLLGKDITGVSEKKMMGGVCFLHNGHMIGGCDKTKAGDSRFMFRIGKDNEAEALCHDGVSIMEQGGRRMGGMVFVDPDQCEDTVLQRLMALATGYVADLPPK